MSLAEIENDDGENARSENPHVSPSQSITELLRDLPARQEELYDLVLGQLKAIAQKRLAGEKPGHTLQATALVGEVYLKLAGQECSWRDRRHFFGVAAQAMRRILVDSARSRDRAKRGGKGVVKHSLSGIQIAEPEFDADLLALNEALDELERLAPENAEVVNLKFFSGLSLPECAEVLGVSLSTIERRWRFARAWLRDQIR